MGHPYEKLARKQGFDCSLDESPIETPSGWCDGGVEQTGGNILARVWRSRDIEGEESGGGVKFQCIYGSEPGVSINRYTWDESSGYHVFDREVESRPVTPNTDAAKAGVAKEMMEKFEQVGGDAES